MDQRQETCIPRSEDAGGRERISPASQEKPPPNSALDGRANAGIRKTFRVRSRGGPSERRLRHEQHVRAPSTIGSQRSALASDAKSSDQLRFASTRGAGDGRTVTRSCVVCVCVVVSVMVLLSVQPSVGGRSGSRLRRVMAGRRGACPWGSERAKSLARSWLRLMDQRQETCIPRCADRGCRARIPRASQENPALHSARAGRATEDVSRSCRRRFRRRELRRARHADHGRQWVWKAAMGCTIRRRPTPRTAVTRSRLVARARPRSRPCGEFVHASLGRRATRSAVLADRVYSDATPCSVHAGATSRRAW